MLDHPYVKAVVTAIIFLALLIQPVCAQQQTVPANGISYVELVEQSFGLDQDLINGIQYFDRYMGYKGVPYFVSIGFMDGELTIKERVYQDVRIRYDLFSQSVEVEYDYFFGGASWLVAVTDHIEAFKFGEYPFIKLDIEESSGKFYQVIRTNQFTCYVHWEKKILPIQNDQFFTEEFSAPKSTCLLEMNGEINVFKNRKSFAELFPEHQRKEIKRLYRKNQFRVKKASPNELVYHMNAVANLIKNGTLP
ncbi:MAG: hypothetical protein ABFS38_05090 [Bacteroidota bacterium]